MVRPKRIRSAFWLFLLLLALGLGWAANQEWRWPSLALFDQDSETDGQAPAPEVVAEQPTGEPATEEPTAETALAEPGPAPVARQPAEAEPEAGPAVTDPAPSPEGAPAQEQEESVSEPAPPAPTPGDASPTVEPAEAEVAAIEPPDLDVEAPATDSGSAAPAPEPVVVEPPAAAPDQDQTDDTSTAAHTEDTAASVEPTGEPPGAAPDQDQADTSTPASTEDVAALGGAAATDPGPIPGAGLSFDIVRVGRDGRAVIAGRAAPGAEVEVRSGGQVIDRVHATRRGEWVAIPARPLTPGDQELSAVATQGGAAVESEQVVVVAVPGAGTPATPAAGETSAPAEPVAVLLPRDGKGGGRILQAPGRLSAEGTLALMTVSYDDSGEVLLSGEAPPGVPVRIYVDNRPAALVVGDAKGAWSSGLDEVLAPGTYTLRLDQLDADGQAVARIETPFTRVSEPPVEGDLQVDYVVVQPGNSLWRIARRLSGRGLDYVYIYDANQAQIRDPDLIYPGQVFEIPPALGSAG